VRIEKPSYTGPAPEETPAEAPAAAVETAAGGNEPESDDVAVSEEPLPLTA
jgi:hypothetical protein